VIPDSWADHLVQCRTALGLSQKEAARRLGVDSSTLARWERGERRPAGVLLNQVKRFLKDEDGQHGRNRQFASPLSMYPGQDGSRGRILATVPAINVENAY
jgi:transcriptional regulator with XRE-family HTH domain